MPFLQPLSSSWVRPKSKKTDIWQVHCLDLVDMYQCAKNYQNIPSSFIFPHFCIGEAIYKVMWHLPSSVVESFQYLSVCQILPN